jgi:hypothetical protein
MLGDRCISLRRRCKPRFVNLVARWRVPFHEPVISLRPLSFAVSGGMPMRGTLTFPGDKSLSHRAAILATLANGTSTISNFLDAGDTMNTLKAMQALGARVSDLGNRTFRVESGGVKSLRSPETVIDCGKLWHGGSPHHGPRRRP